MTDEQQQTPKAPNWRETIEGAALAPMLYAYCAVTCRMPGAAAGAAAAALAETVVAALTELRKARGDDASMEDVAGTVQLGINAYCTANEDSNQPVPEERRQELTALCLRALGEAGGVLVRHEQAAADQQAGPIH